MEYNPRHIGAVGNSTREVVLEPDHLGTAGVYAVLGADCHDMDIAVVIGEPPVSVAAAILKGHLVSIRVRRPVVERFVVAGSGHEWTSGRHWLVLNAPQIPNLFIKAMLDTEKIRRKFLHGRTRRPLQRY